MGSRSSRRHSRAPVCARCGIVRLRLPAATVAEQRWVPPARAELAAPLERTNAREGAQVFGWRKGVWQPPQPCLPIASKAVAIAALSPLCNAALSALARSCAVFAACADRSHCAQIYGVA